MHGLQGRNTEPGTDEGLCIARMHSHVGGEKTDSSANGLRQLDGYLEKKILKLHLPSSPALFLPAIYYPTVSVKHRLVSYIHIDVLLGF